MVTGGDGKTRGNSKLKAYKKDEKWQTRLCLEHQRQSGLRKNGNVVCAKSCKICRVPNAKYRPLSGNLGEENITVMDG